MPARPARPCTHIGCTALCRDGTGRCPDHPKEAWAKAATAPRRITGRKLQELRKALFRAHPLCVLCLEAGRTTAATERDHIRPLSETGKDLPTNEGMQALCHDCHEAKSRAERARAAR
ncbi:HNH endonuclease [Variovorax saccharolyticus]|uniref:HNH endonuclease n=1 Tax=Variovorax saccharolyticus TaxID=3053516 RepID=UPI0025762252|nr:HNH endonuclease signature motif containing protein [Variovorax sp. J31P216]MDM0024090.1 HNH endonuclease signature motif containing protein [Variovorax sp. J31P216]